MPTIRDTIDPLREREVSEQEFTDLDRQGVILTGTRAKTPEGLRAAAVRQVEQRQADAFADTKRTTAVPAGAVAGVDVESVPDRETGPGVVEPENDPARTDDQQES